MKPKKLTYSVKPPCSQCPYTLGMVHTLKSPCTQCRQNGYQFYEQFQGQLSGTCLVGEKKQND